MKCLNCGKEIVGRPKQARFCSPDCFRAFHKSTGQAFGNCLVCGTPFKKNNSQQKYCSDRCRIFAFYQRAKDRHRETVCPQCGKSFENKGSNGRFCSKACVRAHRQGLKKNTPPAKSFAQWIDEARQCNLDYGTYRALIGLGKSFEELKAQAANHVGCHASKHLFL